VNFRPLSFQWTGPAAIKIRGLHSQFLWRAGLVAVFAVAAHQFTWGWLRFVTSEVILRISTAIGMITTRVSYDTILMQRELFCFVIACTFIDVFLGSIPLLWDLEKSLLSNALRLIAAAAALFCFNVVRLEIGQILYFRGVSWTLAHEAFGGFAYLVVWLALWRNIPKGSASPPRDTMSGHDFSRAVKRTK
jgi:hypothetical protein